MPRKLLSLLFLVTISLQLSAQHEKSLLLQVSGNGLKQNSYIFGTIHIIKKSEFFLPDVVKNTLKQTQVFITEVDMNIPILQQLDLMNKMYIPDGKTIKDFVSEEDFQAFRTIVQDSLGVSPKQFEKYIRIKPFFTSALLIQKVIGKVKAYEKELYKIAKNKGIPSDGLESLDFQFSLVDATPIKEQAEGLVKEVKDFRQSMKGYGEMVNIYKEQDLDKLYTMMVNDTNTDSEFNQKFLFKRNLKWIPIIEKRISEYSCFIAVGGAHLPGDNGVLELLRKKGYTVTAIK